MADKYRDTLDFLRNPFIWGTVVLVLAYSFGFKDEIKEIFGILGDFLMEINPL